MRPDDLGLFFFPRLVLPFPFSSNSIHDSRACRFTVLLAGKELKPTSDPAKPRYRLDRRLGSLKSSSKATLTDGTVMELG